MVGKKNTERLVKDSLVNSAKNVAEKIEIFTSTVDSRELKNKAFYLISKEYSFFNSNRLKVSLYIFDQDGNIVLSAGENKDKNFIPNKVIREVIEKTNEIIEAEKTGGEMRLALESGKEALENILKNINYNFALVEEQTKSVEQLGKKSF